MRAFPSANEIWLGNSVSKGHAGMDLRDYFAAKALMSMLSPVQQLTETTPEVAAKWSYKFADAMMKERNAGS